VLIATGGSLGDLHPFIAIAHALSEEGLHPVVAASGYYRDYILSEGLSFAPIRPDFDDMTQDLSLDLHGIAREMAKDNAFLFRSLIFPYLRRSYEDIFAAANDAALIVAHSLGFAAHASAEILGKPLAIVALSPMLIPSADDPPAGVSLPYVIAPRSDLARTYNRVVREAAHRVAQIWATPLRRFRRRIGLRNELGAGPLLMGPPPAAIVGLYSPLLAPLQEDHPPGFTVAGFSFHDRFMNSGEALRPALEEFLDAGPAPIVFTLGSFFVRDQIEHFRACIGAAEALGRRAIVLVHADDLAELGVGFSTKVMIASYVPHSWLFPSACAIVHHAGAGTSGQAMRAGAPQLVTPVMGDQFDNAARLERLGVALSVAARNATAGTLRHALERLLSDEKYAARAREISAIVENEDGARITAKIVHNLIEDFEKRNAAS